MNEKSIVYSKTLDECHMRILKQKQLHLYVYENWVELKNTQNITKKYSQDQNDEMELDSVKMPLHHLQKKSELMKMSSYLVMINNIKIW